MAYRKYTFIVALVTFIILGDWIVGGFLEAGFYSEQSLENDRVVHSFSATEAALLVFGSSSALHHYNTELIQDSLNITSYNVGAGGQNIYYHNLLLKTVLSRYTPKTIILDLFNIDFEETVSTWNKERLAVLLPLSAEHKIIDSAFRTFDPNHKVKMFSHTYPFNSEIYRIVRNNFIPYHNSFNGFMPIGAENGLAESSQPVETKTSGSLDSSKVAEMESFINDCLNEGIDLKLIVSPSFFLYEKGDSYEQFISYLNNEFPVEIYSFQNDPFFVDHPELFKDANHLNAKGADVFTERVLSLIK